LVEFEVALIFLLLMLSSSVNVRFHTKTNSDRLWLCFILALAKPNNYKRIVFDLK
jgi:hypothetical protein